MVDLSADQSSRRTLDRAPSYRHVAAAPCTAGFRRRHNIDTRGSLVRPGNPGTLRAVLANGAHTSPSPSRVGLAKIAIAVGVIAAVVVGGKLLFDDEGGPRTPGGTGVSSGTPAFDFKVAKTVVVPVSPDQKGKKVEAPVTAASHEAVGVMDTVYTETFLDRNSWVGANYEDAWTQFTQDAATEAQADIDALTAGNDAGDTYDTIIPVRGTVKPRVLVDEKGQPVSIQASVVFTAEGAHGDGTYTLMRSTAEFFLRTTGDSWKVVAFQVRRADSEETAPQPSRSGSGSAEPTEAAS